MFNTPCFGFTSCGGLEAHTVHVQRLHCLLQVLLSAKASGSQAAWFFCDASTEVRADEEGGPCPTSLHVRGQVRGAALVCISIISTLVVLAVTRRKPVQSSDDMASVDMRPPVKARHSDLVA